MEVVDDSHLDKKLTLELIETVSNFVRTSVSIEVALRLCGINQREVTRWLKLADQVPGSIYEEFRTKLNQADAEREHQLVMLLNGAAIAGDSKATIFMLQQQFPNRWGKFAGSSPEPANPFLDSPTKTLDIPASTKISQMSLEDKKELLRIMEGTEL